MTDLKVRIEVMRLANELGIPEGELAYLRRIDADALRELRTAISDAQFARQRNRFELLAALTRLLPVAVAAKIAEGALGPLLSSRVAAVLKPDDGVRLAMQLKPPFLAEIAAAIDPTRILPIITRLPAERLVMVGRILLEHGEHLTLGRLISVVDLDVAMQVVESASPADLLRVALFAEDPQAIVTVVRRLPDDTLAAVLHAAAEREGANDSVLGDPGLA